MHGLTVLVVDDETRHRRGLASLIRRLRPGFEVAEAKNGREAYERLLMDAVDLLITDIRMPVMDGMELIELLQTMPNHGKIILLTAYAQFEYAQKAISFGVYDYIVKPVDVDRIAALLDRAEACILEERSREAERDRLVSQWIRTYPFYYGRQLQHWLQGQTEADQVDGLAERFTPGSLAMVLVCKAEVSAAADSGEGMDAALREAELARLLLGFGGCVTFRPEEHPNRIVAVVNMTGTTGPRDIEAALDGFVSSLAAGCAGCLTVGLGTAYPWQGPDIVRSYNEALAAAEYGFYNPGASRVISYTALPPMGKRCGSGLPQADPLAVAVRQGDFRKAEELLRCFFQEAEQDGYPHPLELKETASRLLVHASGVFGALIPADDYGQLVAELEGRIGECRAFPDFRRAALGCVKLMMDKMEELHRHGHDSVLAACLGYIESHYQEDGLSLEELARRFHFNLSYFSNFIKKKTGVSFSRHLLNVRMSHAKDLLRQTDCKIYEIAERVGYKDVKYFNRVFKKECGVSPYTFRQLAFLNGEEKRSWIFD